MINDTDFEWGQHQWGQDFVVVVHMDHIQLCFATFLKNTSITTNLNFHKK